MNNKIRTYKDLLEEKSRLQTLLSLQKQEVRNNFSGVKEALKPVNLAFSYLSKFFTRKDNNPIIQNLIRFLSDFVLKRVLLARAGWVTRTFIPILFRNYASNMLKARQNEILYKMATWLRAKRVKEA